MIPSYMTDSTSSTVESPAQAGSLRSDDALKKRERRPKKTPPNDLLTQSPDPPLTQP
jgi:hypothetical protein